MDDLLDITDKVIAVAVLGAGATTPVDAYTDGNTSISAMPTPPGSART